MLKLDSLDNKIPQGRVFIGLDICKRSVYELIAGKISIRQAPMSFELVLGILRNSPTRLFDPFKFDSSWFLHALFIARA